MKSIEDQLADTPMLQVGEHHLIFNQSISGHTIEEGKAQLVEYDGSRHIDDKGRLVERWRVRFDGEPDTVVRNVVLSKYATKRLTRTLGSAVVLLALCFASMAPTPAVADDWQFKPFVEYTHTSDLFRGWPFEREAEPTSDYIGAGLSIRWRDTLQFDFSHGVKSRNCSMFYTLPDHKKTCDWESGTQLTLRWMPFRGW